MHRVLPLVIIYFLWGQAIQTEPAKTGDIKSHWKPNPTKSALLSALFPSAGQLYSQSWWHIPIFLAGEGFLAYKSYVWWRKTDSLWNLREQVSPSNPQYQQLKYEFENSAQTRNNYLWALAGVKFLDIVDAYVCAHLYDFHSQINVPVGLSFSAEPPGLCLYIDF